MILKLCKVHKIPIASWRRDSIREREEENHGEEKETAQRIPLSATFEDGRATYMGPRRGPRGIPNSHANKPIYFGEPTSND